MRIDLLDKVSKLYLFRYTQITEMWLKIIVKAEVSKVSTVARNLDDADIVFLGYTNRHRNLLFRLEDLNTDYNLILQQLSRTSIWYKIFRWLPFIKINSDTVQLMERFLTKWEEYDPGW